MYSNIRLEAEMLKYWCCCFSLVWFYSRHTVEFCVLFQLEMIPNFGGFLSFSLACLRSQLLFSLSFPNLKGYSWRRLWVRGTGAICTNDSRLVEMPLSTISENGELSLVIFSTARSTLSSPYHSDVLSYSENHREDKNAFKEHFAGFYFILDSACSDPLPAASVFQIVLPSIMISDNRIFSLKLNK